MVVLYIVQCNGLWCFKKKNSDLYFDRMLIFELNLDCDDKRYLSEASCRTYGSLYIDR